MATGVNVKMGVSGVSQFKNNMNQAKQAVKTLDAQLALSEKQFKASGDAEGYMTEKTELLKAKLEQQKKVADNAQKALDDMTKNGVDRASKAYQDMYRSLLQAKGEPKGETSIKLSWKKVKGAAGYIIYGNKCGKKNHYVKLKTTAKTSYKQKKLEKGTYYKYIVVAFNGDQALAASKTIHVATNGGKIGNNTAVTLDKKKLTIKRKKKAAVKAILRHGPLPVKNHRAVAFESGDYRIATVTSKGKIKGVKKGTCYIYAYAQNGMCAKVKVKVKK